MSSADPRADTATTPLQAEPLEQFLGSFTQTEVVYRYLDMLAERTRSLEQRIRLDEVNQLRRENKALRERLKKANAPSMALLVQYLPIIYHNFWNTVGPEELALHADSQDIPEVASPYEEPNEWRVMDMKHNFQRLSYQERSSIIDFCRQLTYPLRMRRSMQVLMEASV
ncbi:MAG TPA: hypothetical protein DIT18_14925 [Pseudomonas sp.]|nr:hypothetical protein [Pseudomonas sp.]